MDSLKKIANRKLIAITLAVKAVVLFISALVSYSGMSYYYRGMPLALLMLFIIAAGLVVVSYCMISKRNDVVLLVGVAIITFGYMVRFLVSISLSTFVYMLLWLIIGLLAIMITVPDKIPQLENIKKYAMILGLVVAGIFVLFGLSNFVLPFTYSYGFPITTLIVQFITNAFNLLLTAASYSLFALYMGVTAQGEEQSDIDVDLSKVSDTISKVANAFNTTENNGTYTSGNAADELREYKKLLDEGVITEEEFEAKKKQIMGL